jgi:hypothetical protein
MLGASDATVQQTAQWLQDNHMNPENLLVGAALLGVAAVWNQKIYKHACPVHKHGNIKSQKNLEGIAYDGKP